MKKMPSALLLIGAIILLAASLRAPIVAVGPLVADIQQDLAVSSTMMGLIGTLPVLTFAVCSPFAASLGKRFGMEEVLIAALLLLLAGMFIRTGGDSVWMLLGGTIVLSAGIAMGNVLLSGMVKRSLPQHVGRVTSLYSMTMSLTAGLFAAAAVPLAAFFGSWRTALNVWMVFTAAALAVWLVMRWRSGHIPTPVTAQGRAAVQVWRSGLAWAISLMMGLQSLLYYTFSAWLPEILAAKGVQAAEAGVYVMLFQVAAVPAVLGVTALAVRMKRHEGLISAVIGLSVVSLCAIGWWPSALWLWVTLVGVSVSGTFTLSLLLFVWRTESAGEAAALAGMAQTVGYLVAAAGPLGAGWLFERTGSWQWPLAALILLMVMQGVCGWYCARPLTLREAHEAALAKKGFKHG